MKTNPSKKQKIFIIAIIAIGILLAGLILGMDEAQPSGAEQGHGHAEAKGHADDEHHGEKGDAKHADAKEHADEEHHDEAEPQKGPHGGKLFTENGYGVEVTIFEQDVPPEFRLYTYLNGKPLDPSQSQISLTLERLGRKPQEFTFTKEKDYFKSDVVVEEPHSFTVTVSALHNKQPYLFAYTQEEARVTMTPQQLQQSGVEILTAGPARIQTALQLIGEVRLNEDRTVHIIPRLAGIVESVKASAGDRVRKGQVLAVISSQSLAEQRSELITAQKRLSLARTTYEREKKLWEEKISAEQDYLQARTAMEEAQIAVQSAQQKLASLGSKAGSGNLTTYEIRSPIDGIVTDKRISVGTAMKEDADIFTVSDLSTVWVDLTVRAQDLNVVKAGQSATVKATAFNAQETGKVSYIGSVVGEQNRTATARVVLPNPKGIWRPGLPVNVAVVAEEIEVPVAVAMEGVQTVRDWQVVFGRYGNYLEARPLELGQSDGKYVQVIKGLNAGEQYAAKNSFLIKAELGKASASHDH
ncbi:efflux RND transporter periplasmic adaptor subunit [Oxalobacteraceae bacterium R-40]|uniref:Efflux RND transporter periplasmic adaptor subunit n=1 Tax=Keguizhuia sedimenti TaxID=3064264 RepID=A0ABU1BVH4_9BURK|nr:efflux RND transporter periplasmic adaptor subunit [Oxalobacteraceae bacterium R-40]